MPVITRSITTGPTKMTVTGVKRKFIEILDSDDESSTDSEFEPDVNDEVEDEVEDEIENLKDDLKETEQSNDALINIVIKEREKVESLEQELADTKQKYENLLKDVKDIQTVCWTEFVCFAGMLIITSGIAVASAYSCNIHENVLFNV